MKSIQLNGNNWTSSMQYDVSVQPEIKLTFSQPLKESSIANAIIIKDAAGAKIPLTFTLQNKDSVLLVKPTSNLSHLNKYNFSIYTSLQSSEGGTLNTEANNGFITSIDSSRKFPVIPDETLLTKIQQQTFKYFWDFAHPVSGLARERSNGDNETVTSGGSGFEIMAVITGIHRNFITRQEGLERMKVIVSFLKNNAQTFKGAFPHWLNGTTGAAIPFSTKDNGADIVETSFLMQGLLCARQYFNLTNTDETNLRADINTLWNAVEWSWFRQNDQNILYWHWSPDYNWDMNMQVKGWNECLITYVLAAASTTHSISKAIYDEGWASGGNIKNGNTFFNYTLPLGELNGGPLFFEHYSFLGIKPFTLTDTYADYELQTKNHTLINYNYCISNPKGYYGYSDSCWGLTASDIQNGYTASSPTNDVGVIAPTAAISSLPYTPAESMKALKFFYYVLGDKLWKDYGFVDAFSLHDIWFANSFLAIDQGPQIIMIENYRSGLLWNLFMSCPEVKAGLKSLGFNAPGL
ncbi:MAG: glucoamylase family protein [Agriterribacter sp.]